MVIETKEVSPNIIELLSNQTNPDAADRDFLDWAEANHCYTPTASEMEEEDDGRWSIKVMREPVEE